MGRRVAGHREFELKFTIDPRATDRLVSHPKIRPSLKHRAIDRLVSTYFDTPESTLLHHRFGLRVRRGHNSVVHTLKQTGASIVDRGEWERTDSALRPDAAWLRQTPAASLLDDEAVSTLVPRFTVEVTRSTLPLRYKKARIEAAIDQGVILSKGLSLPLNELELEIKRGRPEGVLDLARILVRDLPLALSLASKSERGYGVSDLTWGRPDERIVPTLRNDMTIAQAFEAVVQACLHTFLKNVALISGDQDREAVHKARIALRHLRAVFDLFAPALRRKRHKKLRGHLKWLSRTLGDARDADVFQSAFFEPAASRDDIAGAGELAALMEKERQAAYARLRAALASPRARLFFLDLLVLSMDGVRRGMRDEGFRPFGRRRLAAHRRALVHDARGIRRKPSPDLHEVRKAAKMLRYDLALFSQTPGLGAGASARRLGRRLHALQDRLGALHDGVAMRTHVARVFGAAGQGLPAAVAAERVASAQESDAVARRRAAKAARRVRAIL